MKTSSSKRPTAHQKTACLSHPTRIHSQKACLLISDATRDMGNRAVGSDHQVVRLDVAMRSSRTLSRNRGRPPSPHDDSIPRAVGCSCRGKHVCSSLLIQVCRCWWRYSLGETPSRRRNARPMLSSLGKPAAAATSLTERLVLVNRRRARSSRQRRISSWIVRPRASRKRRSNCRRVMGSCCYRSATVRSLRL